MTKQCQKAQIILNSILDPEPYNQYPVRYVGNCSVTAPTGIDVIKDAISKLLTIHLESDWTVGYALISATTTRDTKKLGFFHYRNLFCPVILFHKKNNSRWYKFSGLSRRWKSQKISIPGIKSSRLTNLEYPGQNQNSKNCVSWG